MFRHFQVTSGDVSLSVRCCGDASQPTVLLVHGYPDSSAVWDALVAPLAEHFQVARFDVRGAGESSAPEQRSAYRLAQLSRDLQAVMDAVSPDRPVHIVGHDWGSIQSWEAVTDPALAQRIASFTSISGPCLDHMGYWLREKLGRPTPANLLALTRQLIRSWYVMLFHLPGTPLLWKLGLARLWPRLLRLTESIQVPRRASQASDGRQGVRLYRANFLRTLLFPRPRHAIAPVQLIIPDEDLYVSAGLFDGLAQWVPELYVRRVKGGHWLPLAKSAWLAQAITDFVMAQAERKAPPGIDLAAKALVSKDLAGKNSQSAQRQVSAMLRHRVTGPLLPFSGKLVVVTGAASGIGRATALAFAQRGASVVVADINLAGAGRTAVLARLHGVSAWPVSVDVGSAEAMQALVNGIEAAFGVPDVVINNAGIGMAGGMLQTSQADWERILHVNLWGVIHGCRLFGSRMLQAGNGGHIVNVASAAAFTPSRTFPAYATSKAAVLMLSECVRAEYGRFGIGVSAICPGFVDTGIATATRYVGIPQEEERRRQQQAARLYQRRGFTPERVANAIVQAVERDQPLVLVGIEAIGARWLHRLSPAATRLFARIDFSPN